KVVGEVESFGSVEIVRSRLGNDFDATGAQLVVFRRKWVLIDPDLPDGFLRWRNPAAETIDEDRCSTGSGAGSGDRGQLRNQIVRIVRQRLQILASQHGGAGIIRWLRRNG